MRKLTSSAAVVLLCLGGLLAVGGRAREGERGAPFWEQRSYQVWTAAEVVELLTHSPWSRPATLVEPGVDLRLGKTRYYAQWYSARTVREALIRMRELQGRANPPEDAKFLDRPHDRYEVYLFAGFLTAEGGIRTVPLAVVEGMRAEELQQSAILMLNPGQQTLRPDGVRFVRDAETKELKGVVLTFLRAPEAALTGGQVQVVCPTNRGSLSATFSLVEMQRAGRPDL